MANPKPVASWRPGQCGNPNGRPKMTDDAREVKEILKAACPRAALKMVELLDCTNPKIVLATSTAILDRVFGKPKESVDMNVSQDDNMQLQVRGVLLEELKRKHDDSERECTGCGDVDTDCGSELREATITIGFTD